MRISFEIIQDGGCNYNEIAQRCNDVYSFKTATWHSLLQSPIFINLHLNRTTTTKDELILLKHSIRLEECLYKNMSFLYCNDDDTLNHVSPDIDVPLISEHCSNAYQLLGPCHGLLKI